MIDPRTDRSDEHPDPFRQAGMALAAFVAAIVLVVTGGLAGAAMGTHGGTGMSTGSTAATATEAAAAPMAFMLDGVPMDVAAHYHFAAAHPNAYGMIPCFCGCAATLDHRSLHDCFVRADGGGWEVHASGCAVCIDESTTARRMLRQGRPKAEVRDAVLADYGMLASDPGTA